MLVAEINAAGQFTHYHDIDALQQFRLDREASNTAG